MKVFLFGRDNVGWSIDEDRKYAGAFLRELGYMMTSNFLRADIVHSIWWNLLLGFKAYPLRRKKIIAVITHEESTDSPEFLKGRRFVNLWIAPSQAMYRKLELVGADVRYQPFYVDEKIFTKLDKSKKELAQELGIDYELLRGKFVIISTQRDSLGTDLGKPKWQKEPGLLINILSGLPKDKFILLLAGPRRRWVIDQCRERHIPYWYYGEEPQGLTDDIWRNTLDKPCINKLHNLADLYIVSSRSEGGPKAVLESAFAKTMILSTGVGLAPDFLHPWCIYRTAEEAIPKIKGIMGGEDIARFLKANYEKAYSIASYKLVMERWGEIYGYFEEEYFGLKGWE